MSTLEEELQALRLENAQLKGRVQGLEFVIGLLYKPVVPAMPILGPVPNVQYDGRTLDPSWIEQMTPEQKLRFTSCAGTIAPFGAFVEATIVGLFPNNTIGDSGSSH